MLERLDAGDRIRIDFPVVEAKGTCTLKWGPEDRWLETTAPGRNWQPHDPPDRFTFTLKGNTLVDVAARAQGPGYPIYPGFPF